MMSSLGALATADVGVIGLDVMGENLALNIEDHGFRVALWNHTEAKVASLIQRAGTNRRWIGAHTYQRIDRPDAGFVHTDWQALIAADPPGAKP
ncbi:MAG: NAD(P)-binding domain-containing protein [Gemmatimonadaceae bacterium]